MRRIIPILLFFLCLPVLSFCSESDELELKNTDHFYFSVPSSWLSFEDDPNAFYTEDYSDSSGSYILFMEINRPEARNLELRDYYKSLQKPVLVGFNNPVYTSEFFKFGGSEAAVLSFRGSAPSISAEWGEYCVIFYHIEDYTLACIFCSHEMSSSDLLDVAACVFSTVGYGEPPKVYYAYDYKTAVRNPEECEGDLVSLEGTVAQVLGSRKRGYNIRLEFKGNYNCMVYIIADSKHVPTSNILEGDQLYIEGVASGEHTYESKGGDDITLPLVRAHSIDILNLK